jgi:WD40 repeat protein
MTGTVRSDRPVSSAATNVIESDPQLATTSDSRSSSLPVVPGYEFLQELGRGGMGVVYQARQIALNRLVALKMVLAGQRASASERARFKSEAEAVARLQHPNIVQIYEIGEADGTPYFSLEYLDGGSLDRKLAENPLAPTPAAQLLVPLARAMHAAHAQGIVHRDLKPANVLLARDGTPKITDFGLAKRLDADQAQTRTGAVLGTPCYMSPEQALGDIHNVGPATDIYSLGAVLYELLTGRPPFRGASVLDTLEQVRFDEPVSPRRLQPKVPRDLDTICLKCLHKDPVRRYETAAALADDIERLLRSEPIRARPVGVGERLVRWIRRNPALAAVSAAIAVTILVAFVAVSLSRNQAIRARNDANDAKNAALNLATDNERLAQQEQTQRQQAELQTTRLLYEQAYARCQQGDPRSLHWLARALEHAHHVGASDVERAVRRQLTAWRNYPFKLQAMHQHSGEISAADLSPDGSKAITGSMDGFAQVWDVETGQPLGPRLELGGWVRAVAFSPDGRKAVAGSTSFSAILWDVEKARPIATLLHFGEVWVVGFTPDGKKVLTGASDRLVRLWDAETGQLTKPSFVHGALVAAAAFRRDGKLLATSSAEGKVRLWNPDSGQAAGPPLEHGARVEALAFSPDGSALLTGCWDQVARVWDVNSGKERYRCPHEGAVNAVAFTPDGGRIVTAGDDRAVRLWDAGTGKPIATPFLHESGVVSIRCNSAGTRALTSSWDSTARLWSLQPREPHAPPIHHPSSVRIALLNRDESRILTAGADGVARVWRATPQGWSGWHHGFTGTVNRIAFSPDQHACAFATDAKMIHQFDVRTLQALGPPIQLEHMASALAYDRAGKTLLAGTAGRVRRFDAATGKEQPGGFNVPKDNYLMTFSPSGALLVTGSARGTARFWDVARGAPAGTVEHGDFLHVLAFSPDERNAVTVSRDGSTRVWDVQSGRPAPTPATRAIGAIFHPDGRRLITSARDLSVRSWDLGTGGVQGLLLREPFHAPLLVISPDGQTMLTAGGNRAQFWDLLDGKALGPPVEQPHEISAVAASPDGRFFLTTQFGEIRLWANPQPSPATPEQVRRTIEVETGMQLLDDGSFRALDEKTWRQRRRQAEQSPPG